MAWHFLSQFGGPFPFPPLIGPGVTPPSGPVLIPTITDPSTISAAYTSSIGAWLSSIQGAARNIFGVMAALETAWFAVTLFFERHDIASSLLATARKLTVISAFYTLLLFAGSWIPDIIYTFVNLGQNASGIKSLGPSELMQQGVNIAGALLGSAFRSGANWDILTSIAFGFASILVFLGFLALTLQFIMAQIEIAWNLGIGPLFLAFGATRWTAVYVERYIAFAVSAGLKLMSIYLLVGIGWNQVTIWKNQADATQLTLGSAMTAWSIAAGSVIFCAVCWYMTHLISGALGGAPSLAGGHVTGVLGSLAIAATSVASIAAAGAALAGGAAAGGGGAAAGRTTSAGSGASGGGGGGGASNGSGGGGGGGGVAASASRAALTIMNAAGNSLRSVPQNGGGSAPPHANVGH